MRDKAATAEARLPESTLDQELARLGDGDLFEMANLTSSNTGIEGIVCISTAMGAHGPRVKYYLKAGRGQPSFSISVADQPEVLASSLPERVVRQMSPGVIAWVQLNRGALLSFWNEGDTWMADEVSAFIARLQRLGAN